MIRHAALLTAVAALALAILALAGCAAFDRPEYHRTTVSDLNAITNPQDPPLRVFYCQVKNEIYRC